MMTITPPRTESSPDISPRTSPNKFLKQQQDPIQEHHLSDLASSDQIMTAKCASLRDSASDAMFFPSQIAAGNSIFGDSKMSISLPVGSGKLPPVLGADLNLQSHQTSTGSKSDIGSSNHNSSALPISNNIIGMSDVHSDSHLHSLLHGRSLVSFSSSGASGKKGPSPPQESSVFNPLLPININSINGYRNSARKSSSHPSSTAKETLNSISEGSSTFPSCASNNWAGIFSTSGRTSAPVVSTAQAAIGVRGNQQHVFTHRNTMPSMPTSPFSYENAAFAFNNASNCNASSAASNITNAGLCQSSSSLDCFLVQFTSGRTDTFFIPPEANFKVSLGEYVIVEADRGEDLGRVIMDSINVPMPRRNSVSSAMTVSTPVFESGNNGVVLDENMIPLGTPVSSLPKKIHRKAQPVEIESLLCKVRDELNAIAVGQYKVQEWKLPMSIIDAEYQWDRRKLTFFFSVTLPTYFPSQPSPRIDFRTLVRDLYQIYRTRIWMYCVDKDKNRTNRAHNRDKFLKQLNADIERSPSSASTGGDSSGSHTPNRYTELYQKAPNSLKAVLEDHQDHWDVFDKLNYMSATEDLDLESLTFNMADMNMSR